MGVGTNPAATGDPSSVGDQMDQIPFVALLGGSVGAVFIAGIVLTGLIGGVQYLADRRYVTKHQHQADREEMAARMAANEQSIRAMQGSQETMLRLVEATADDVKEIKASLQQTDETVRVLVDNLGDLCAARKG